MNSNHVEVYRNALLALKNTIDKTLGSLEIADYNADEKGDIPQDVADIVNYDIEILKQYFNTALGNLDYNNDTENRAVVAKFEEMYRKEEEEA